jgi:elongation factor Ts
MMDAKRALEAAAGDMEAAAAALREKGLAKSATRADRENTQGTVAIGTGDGVAATALLKSETDFVATSDDFVALVQQLADAVLVDGDSAADSIKDRVDELKIVLKENIEVGELVRFEATSGNELGAYLHKQSGRGVLGVLVELAGGSAELAHDLAVHIAFAKPLYITRDEVPSDQVEAERATLQAKAEASGKPEQAWTKMVEGQLTAWFADTVLLDQKFAKDDKQTVEKVLGGASVVGFSLVSIG